MIELEYKIIYKIGGDIPINQSWIGEQLDLSLQALQKQIEELEDRTINPLIRIADAIEEILRLVKKDMEPRTKKKD